MFKKIIGATLLAACACSVQSAVTILGTRLIYPSNEKSINVQLNNQGTAPALVQVWLDDGNQQADPSKLSVPFIMTPPVTRMNAGVGQTIRVVYTGSKALPQDRETVYYFNLLDIPPAPSAEELERSPNYLQFSVRSRIKLFYRPSSIKIKPESAYQMIEWLSDDQGVQIKNPTPYHMSYRYIKVGNEEIDLTEMVEPYSTKHIPLKLPATKGTAVEWILINDYGGNTLGQAVVK